MLLIPAIDLRGGSCVRLYQGNFDAETRYSIQPAELLQHYRSLGTQWLHVIDLDGARDGVPTHMALIARLAAERDPLLQVGGGMRTARVIEAALAAGVARVVIGSVAVHQPAAVIGWLKHFGPERICLAFDVRIAASGEPLAYTRGWTQKTDVSLWHVFGLFRRHLRHVLCTDIDRDGTLTGPNLDLYRDILDRFPTISLQASGGVRNASDLHALADCGVAAAVSGKALLEQRINREELQPFLPDASFPVSMSVTAR